MPQFTISAEPDPGAEASDEAKMAYYFQTSNTKEMLLSTLNGVRAPLEVCKRTDDDEGVMAVYFANEGHLHYYFHKIVGTDVNTDSDGILEVLQKAAEMDAPDVRVSLKRGEPLAIVWQHPTYADMVRHCYSLAQKTKQEITEVAQQEAAQEEQLKVAIQTLQLKASLAAAAPTAVATAGVPISAAQQQLDQLQSAMQSARIAGQNARNAQDLRTQQHYGNAPTKFVDGVPHYNSSGW